MPEVHSDPARAAAPNDHDLSPMAPFRRPVFRMLWSTWLMANICMWMSDVAAAWMMTSLNATPLWVALVQTASSLPVFLLGLPSGALADILDRKRYFLITQIWVAVVACLLSLCIFLELLSPVLLLLLIFANGIGLAMRWPVFSAIVPELVPRTQLPAALALNGVSMNASRIIGPLVAGALIASAGSAWVFLLNAVLSLAAAVIISRWQRVHVPHPLGRERLLSAMRIGVQYVAQSYHLKGVLLRISIFFLTSTALVALLPLVARNLHGGGAGTFTLLLASMGLGAIISTLFLPQLRRRLARDALVLSGAAVQSAAMLVVALTHHTWIAVPAMLLAGAAWITTANTLSVSAQMGLPDWVRARGMSMYQMAIMGASAGGAALWGQVATVGSVQTSLLLAAVCGVSGMALVNRLLPGQGMVEDLTPSSQFKTPQAEAPPASGHVMVSIEYRIDPARAREFRNLMQESRRSRLSHGALSWELLHDINDPGRFVEMIEDASWTEHLRRFDRVTTADVALRDRKLAFHIGESPPAVNRCVMETTIKTASTEGF
ncbi:Predicted arabinose efflux permease, MFS family [Rhodoferax sp. OV413]|uniref:MFS transporter n=1 Tax=Rhodoferax sp. OV413 TaxID=1855285 RepID=UPI00087FBE94|nr:MFS transporter [Rhodoferax sp. OV413]SDP67894.1 Predicted arabinose efflux permease, MFS family [Rhodoferax sp. OV413]